eukprot:GEMP01123847.1.p1 GENE.GEMP01123847.1~~GEMP01123847.1.p1  ORF type:complete len:113 (+),score=12.38 GEMP01123847.1:213-551(+)
MIASFVATTSCTLAGGRQRRPESNALSDVIRQKKTKVFHWTAQNTHWRIGAWGCYFSKRGMARTKGDSEIEIPFCLLVCKTLCVFVIFLFKVRVLDNFWRAGMRAHARNVSF